MLASSAMKSPFPAGWWSFDLGEYRPCDSTYELYPYEALPPLDEALFRGDFGWLTPAKAPRTAAAPKILAAAAKLGLTLPPAFVRLVREPALQAAIPSCTACEWDPSVAPVPCRVVPGAHLIRFLRDQQDCLFWYLHLLPDGDAHVLCSPIPFDHPELSVTPEVVVANTWYCAPHFEHFVYRFWIENELWDKLGGSTPVLSPAEAAYLGHYAAAQGIPAPSAAPPSAAAVDKLEKPATKATSKKTKKTPARKSPAKQATNKKTASKKTASNKKTASKKTASKKTASKKPASKKPASKKPAKKKPAKKKSAKRTAPKRKPAKKA